MELGWVRASTAEASRDEHQSFVRDQRQLERISTKNRPDVGHILSSWSSQSGFRDRHNLYQYLVLISWSLVRSRDFLVFLRSVS